MATSANYVRICSSSRLQLAACAAGSIPTRACGLDHHVMSAVSFPREWGESISKSHNVQNYSHDIFFHHSTARCQGPETKTQCKTKSSFPPERKS